MPKKYSFHAISKRSQAFPSSDQGQAHSQNTDDPGTGFSYRCLHFSSLRQVLLAHCNSAIAKDH